MRIIQRSFPLDEMHRHERAVALQAVADQAVAPLCKGLPPVTIRGGGKAPHVAVEYNGPGFGEGGSGREVWAVRSNWQERPDLEETAAKAIETMPE